MRKKTFRIITLSLLFILGSNAFAVNPCEQTNQLSGGTIIADTTIEGVTENGYQYQLWRDASGGELTLYPQDMCFKLSWDNPKGYVYANVGKSFGNVNIDSLGGDLLVNYAFQKEGDDGEKYSAIGVECWLDDGQSCLYIVEDWLHEGAFKNYMYLIHEGEYVVGGETYQLFSNMSSNNKSTKDSTLIFSIRETPRQCGTVNVSKHIRCCNAKLNRNNFKFLQKVDLSAESIGGKGSVDFFYSNFEVADSIDNVREVPFVLFDSIEIKPNDKVVTTNSQGNLGNGYSYKFYTESTLCGMLIPGGEKDCAFRGEWYKTSNYMAGIGYLDEKAMHEFSDLGEITADYEYTKTGKNVDFSYIGVYGLMQYPMEEFYIVDDMFDFRLYVQNLREIGSYEMDGSVYTLYTTHRIIGDLGDIYDFVSIYAIRSSFRTSGHISVSEHFQKWEELDVKLGRIYSCMISCEAYNGTGSIDYSKATMSWKGLEKDMESPTLTKNVTSSDAIILVPNPAKNFFTVKCPEEISSIEILDVFGRSLNSQIVGATVTFDLPVGTYIVKIMTVDGNVSIQKLIVK